MNLLHLKYALEVGKTFSINKAAENLYMSQPNLSRAIKELEENLGITLFHRSPKGIHPTDEGVEFLTYAQNILRQVEEVESLYKKDKQTCQRFSISVPRASYISCAFRRFVADLDSSKEMELCFKETNSLKTIQNVNMGEYSLGIIRYQQMHERYFNGFISDKGLKSQLVAEFTFLAVMSQEHPLAQKEIITLEDLSNYIEIAHGDPYVPSMPLADVKKAELTEHIDKRIFVFERGSQFDLLCDLPTTYMWVSPIPNHLLKRYGLVQRKINAFDRVYKDMLIYKKDYKISPLEKMFISRLEEAAEIVKFAVN